ncbi:hypothetical protein SCP_1303710 [Sparassis crispa]|uniref:Uncharacterized protein n=1 Tax=Sparassis crispa TaxID=139825 RepID=A0A401H297_9APHY|nr:hypothetical protein SCP_1303710 [Sparassis crispa]GBE88555.1 hypothetical protein SCP_1303710 [Sparassis crispa]
MDVVSFTRTAQQGTACATHLHPARIVPHIVPIYFVPIGRDTTLCERPIGSRSEKDMHSRKEMACSQVKDEELVRCESPGGTESRQGYSAKIWPASG